MVGRKLGHYDLIERLGSGRAGEIYRAWHTRTGCAVALRILPAAMAENADVFARLERRAKILADLNHPNLVMLYSVERDADTAFVTMELVDGVRLSDEIGQSGMVLTRLLKLAISLADAVAAIHQAGILHRALSVDNIMINRGGQAKLLSDGLARYRYEGPESLGPRSNVMDASSVMIALVAMSPEEANGFELDARSEVFSLGAILYQISTGRGPFTGETLSSIIVSILHDDPVPATRFRPSLPEELQHIIDRCLCKDPEKRFQTVLELRNALQGLETSLNGGDQAEGGASSGESPSVKGRWVTGW